LSQAGQDLEDGKNYKAWRIAVNALRSADRVVNISGVAELVALASKDQKGLVPPVRALLEDRLIHSRDLDWAEVSVVLGLYDRLGWPKNPIATWGPPAHDIDLDDLEKQASRWAQAGARYGHLPRLARPLCSKLLASLDPRARRGATPILIVAARLGGRDREWCIRVCQKQTQVADSDRTGMWGVLYETVLGHFIPEPHPPTVRQSPRTRPAERSRSQVEGGRELDGAYGGQRGLVTANPLRQALDGFVGIRARTSENE
jgi:hypothetical protein